jgi:hypothetical protein
MDWINDVGVLSGVTEVHITRGQGHSVMIDVTGNSSTYHPGQP